MATGSGGSVEFPYDVEPGVSANFRTQRKGNNRDSKLFTQKLRGDIVVYYNWVIGPYSRESSRRLGGIRFADD